jgi:hypothetical protein
VARGGRRSGRHCRRRGAEPSFQEGSTKRPFPSWRRCTGTRRTSPTGHDRRSLSPISTSAIRSGSGRPRSHMHRSGGQLGLTVPQMSRSASCPRLSLVDPSHVARAMRWCTLRVMCGCGAGLEGLDDEHGAATPSRVPRGPITRRWHLLRHHSPGHGRRSTPPVTDPLSRMPWPGVDLAASGEAQRSKTFIQPRHRSTICDTTPALSGRFAQPFPWRSRPFSRRRSGVCRSCRLPICARASSSDASSTYHDGCA